MKRKALSEFTPQEIAEGERLISWQAELNKRFDETGKVEPVKMSPYEIALLNEYTQALMDDKLKNLNL